MNKKLLDPLARRVRLLLARGIVRLVNDAGGLQSIQATLMQNETRSGLERLQEYGFTSVPLEGAECAAIFIGGARDHGLIIATDDRRFRLKELSPGEVALYTDEGDKIELRRNNQIRVTTSEFLINCDDMTVNCQNMNVNCDDMTVNAGNNVTFETPLVRASNDIFDRYGSNSDSIYAMRTIFNTHTHPENDNGGPTDPPNQTMDS